jgi:hypothetical protein
LRACAASSASTSSALDITTNSRFTPSRED